MIEFAPFATSQGDHRLDICYVRRSILTIQRWRMTAACYSAVDRCSSTLSQLSLKEANFWRNETSFSIPLLCRFLFSLRDSSIFLLSIVRLYAWRGRKVEEFEKRRNSVSSAHVPGTSFYCGSMNREMKRYTKGKPSTSPLSSLFFCITTIFRTWTSLRIFHLVSGRAKMETILQFVILIISISWKNLGTRL